MSARGRLSKSQEEALMSIAREGPVDDIAALVRFGKNWRATLESLEARGLLRYYYTSNLWKTTIQGRWRADDIEAMRFLKAKDDEKAKIVRDWQSRKAVSP